MKTKMVRLDFVMSGILDMLLSFDTCAGRLGKFLDVKGLAENKILIFITDEGTTHGNLYHTAGMRNIINPKLYD